MACFYTMNGKRFSEPEFKQHLREMPLAEAAKHIPGIQSLPDMPFKKNWHELALKRMIAEAVDKGYDQVAWTTGDMQAARYDLAKHVKEIEYIKYPDGSYRLGITAKNGEGVDLPQFAYKPEELPNLVGRDVANKIISGEGRKFRGHEGVTLSGLDLKIGGEGMKAFYDQILPQAANKITKQYGARAEQQHMFEGSPEKWKPWKDADGRWRLRASDDGYISSLDFKTPEEALAFLNSTKSHTVHVLQITPALREAVKQGRIPLFSRGGRVESYTQRHFFRAMGIR